MWIKYEYLCTNCDSLFELTTQNPLVFEPVCSCDSQHIIRINRYNVTELTEPHLDIIGEAHYN
jgi:DNA-directed RNA polymerase subunit RPC12/RpoP